MTRRELPILDFSPFRKFPTKLDRQEYDEDQQACQNCLSGGCCSSEHPIYLTGFDVFRLSAFFNLSPAEFMLKFTQERFDDPESDGVRRQLIDAPDCSIITYLRRRENSPVSPCIFLKYVRDPDGTPRRICSIHEGRPLSCREFYANHCRLRVTGELAVLQAEGFEKIRDGEITEAVIDARLANFAGHDPHQATLSRNMEYFFWVEMKRAADMERANWEGANSYDMADYQDPIDVKLNRMLSSKYLRFEEKYGLRARDEQLAPYTAGLTWAGSAEYERIMTIISAAPSTGLYALGNYPFHVGLRTGLPGVKAPSAFPVIPDDAAGDFIRSIPRVLLFPQHDVAEVRAITLCDVYAAVLKGYNHLIRFASYVATMGDVLEWDEPGFVESEMFLMVAEFETSLNPFVAQNPYLQPVKHYMAGAVIENIEKKLASEISPQAVFDQLRFLTKIKNVVPSLPADIRARFEAAIATVNARLHKEDLGSYVSQVNPVAARETSGKRLNVVRAWAEWGNQVIDMRCAALAGFTGIDLPSFYRQSVEDLERIPLRKSYALELYGMVYNLAYSMSSYHTVACQDEEYRDTARRLASYAIRLFHWMAGWGQQTLNCEMAAGFLAPVYKGLGLGYNDDRSFGLLVRQLLDEQLPDGSWQTDPLPEDAPGTQGEYLCAMYRATWACIDALRPMKNDTSNRENASLGLV